VKQLKELSAEEARRDEFIANMLPSIALRDELADSVEKLASTCARGVRICYSCGLTHDVAPPEANVGKDEEAKVVQAELEALRNEVSMAVAGATRYRWRPYAGCAGRSQAASLHRPASTAAHADAGRNSSHDGRH
jgi:hypothetical protein